MPRCVERDLRQKRRILLLCFTPMRLASLVFSDKTICKFAGLFFFSGDFFFVAVSALFFIVSRGGRLQKMTFVLGICCPAVRKTKGVCMHAHESQKRASHQCLTERHLLSVLF